MHEVVLSGCTPEPLMNYLKALGILRLIAEDREHGDPAARGFWRDDVFVLRSRLDEKTLEAFFLDHYRPTPIVVPWSGGDFFAVDWDAKPLKHKKTPTSAKVIEAFLASSTDRLAAYREVLSRCKEAMDACEVRKKEDIEPNKGAAAKRRKVDLLVHLRACLNTEAIFWLDAAAVASDSLLFSGMLGSGGGSDGNTHFSDNFMQNIWDVLPDFDVQRDPKAPRDEIACRDGLRTALFRDVSTFRVEKRTSSLFDSGAVGGPNATQGMERESMSNPWDVILGLEGTLCFAAAAVKRLGSGLSVAAAFPFQFSASPTIRDGLAEKEGSGREVWLPMWHRAATIGEIRSLLSEGRAEAGSRPARNGVDMARSIATLGVDRGIGAFSRYAIVKGRVGGDNYNTAASLGRFMVTEHPAAHLLLEPAFVDWLDSFRWACRGDGVPSRFPVALRAIDAAVVDFCRYGESIHFRSMLMALGKAERELANAERFREEKRLGPLAGLSSEWITAARPDDHQTAMEFEIALALAGVRHEPEKTGERPKIGPLRSNLEPITTWYDTDEQRTKAKWAEKDRAVVWNAADLSTNLAAVLARRVMDGERTGCKDLPLASRHGATPAAVTAFLHGELDERRIEELLWGLMLVESGRSPVHNSGANDISSLPLTYCLFKLLFLPRGLVNMAGEQDKPRWRLAGQDDEHPVRTRPEPRILTLLRAERVREAAMIAMRRLWVSGLSLWCSHASHNRQCQVVRSLWASGKLAEHLAFNRGDGRRLAAALLIPISHQSVGLIAQRAPSLELWTDAIS